MIVKKPSIFIYTNNADQDVLREVCAGIEEEGIFYEILEFSHISVNELTQNAARDSMLGTGIGIAGTQVALTMRGLKSMQMIEQVQKPSVEVCRKIGSNSARIIKKMPLKIGER